MTLTQEDVKALMARFPAEDHETRVGGKKKDGTKKWWLFYIEEGAVIERLNEVDPAWTLEITRTVAQTGYVATYGTLTIKGVSRSGVGTNSSDSGAITENAEKGAATDLLKRLARLFGIGLYLKKSPMVWLDASLKDWDAEKQAISRLAKWLGESPQRSANDSVFASETGHWGAVAMSTLEENTGDAPVNKSVGTTEAKADRVETVEDVDWSKFWPWVKGLGLTKAEVHEALGVELSAKEFIGSKQQMMDMVQAAADRKRRATVWSVYPHEPNEMTPGMVFKIGDVPMYLHDIDDPDGLTFSVQILDSNAKPNEVLAPRLRMEDDDIGVLDATAFGLFDVIGYDKVDGENSLKDAARWKRKFDKANYRFELRNGKGPLATAA
jgi:hypothetical protein